LVQKKQADMVVITGHDNGAGVPSLFGLLLHTYEISVPVNVITFGEEKSLNKVSQYYYNSRLNIRKSSGFTYNRIANAGDSSQISISDTVTGGKLYYPGTTTSFSKLDRNSKFEKFGLTDTIEGIKKLCNLDVNRNYDDLFKKGDYQNVKKIFPDSKNEIKQIGGDEQKKENMPNVIVFPGKDKNNYLGVLFDNTVEKKNLGKDLEPVQDYSFVKIGERLYAMNSKKDDSCEKEPNKIESENRKKNEDLKVNEDIPVGEIEGSFIKPFMALGRGCVIC